MEKNMENKDPNEIAPNKVEIITITDTHNDYEAIIRNLKIHNIIDENGEWKKDAKNVRVVHTGDVVNKRNPDKKSLEYMFHLKATAPESCSVKILAGNHEMEYLMTQTGVAEEGTERKLIEEMSLIEATGPVLFLHGYPTRKLLRWILSYVENEGMSVADAVEEINRQFSEALLESSAGYNNKLKHFLFGDKDSLVEVKEEKPKPLFRKVLPADYYKKHGKEVSWLLAKLGFDVVIHGHSRTQKGLQKIGEHKEHLPGITMIDNDVAISEFKSSKPSEPTTGNKWGSTKITLKSDADGGQSVSEMVFVNKNTHNALELKK